MRSQGTTLGPSMRQSSCDNPYISPYYWVMCSTWVLIIIFCDSCEHACWWAIVWNSLDLWQIDCNHALAWMLIFKNEACPVSKFFETERAFVAYWRNVPVGKRAVLLLIIIIHDARRMVDFDSPQHSVPPSQISVWSETNMEEEESVHAHCESCC